VDYLHWQRRRRTNAAAWRWHYPSVPPPDVVEEPPPGRALFIIPRRLELTARTAYAIPALPIGPDEFVPVEIAIRLWPELRLERRAAASAYALSIYLPEELAAESPIELRRRLEIFPHSLRRAASNAYAFLVYLPEEPVNELPIELRRALAIYPLGQRRAAQSAYWIESPFPGAGDLPEELRRILAVYPLALPRAAQSAYWLWPPFPGAGDLPEELRRALAAIPQPALRRLAAYALYPAGIAEEPGIILPPTGPGTRNVASDGTRAAHVGRRAPIKVKRKPDADSEG